MNTKSKTEAGRARAFRVDPVLWEQAQAKAASEGRTVTSVLRDALRAYVGAAS